MEPIRVVINGAFGRMGQEITKSVVCEPGLRLVGAVENTRKSLRCTMTRRLTLLQERLSLQLERCRRHAANHSSILKLHRKYSAIPEEEKWMALLFIV